jgi:hypothetical protein
LNRPVIANSPPCPVPVLAARNVRYEVADRAKGVACGGLGAMHLLARHGLDGELIDWFRALRVPLSDSARTADSSCRGVTWYSVRPSCRSC